MRNLRISAISFLNTAPLMWDFEHGDAARDFEIGYTVPSRCADALSAGTADIGIIPAAAYATIPGLVILPHVAIAATGPVRSILLVCRKPLDQVRTVAADTNSRTTIQLARLLFRKWWGGDPDFIPMAPDADKMLDACDAAVIIGDAALRVDCSRYLTYDLAEEWQRLTGKPFVFAFWAVRMAALRDLRPGLQLEEVFASSRDHGLAPASLDVIAKEWASRVGITEDDVRSYLTRNIHYSFDRECLAGLELFFSNLVANHLLVTPAPPLRFLGAVQLLSCAANSQ